MTAVSTTPSTTPTTDGTVGNRKTYLTGKRPGLRVPMREVVLSTGDSVVLYDTWGPYTDRDYEAEVRRGLPALRRRGSPNGGTRSATTAVRCALRTTAASPLTCATSTRCSRRRDGDRCGVPEAEPSRSWRTRAAAS